MSAKANYFKLGLFILLAATVAIVGVLALGAGRFFEKKIVVETYLNESVQGVDIGSKIKFRGVTVGNIRRIDFTRNFYELDQPRADRKSYVLIEADLHAHLLGMQYEEVNHQAMTGEVDRGLRVRITAQGVTGASYLELDYLDPQRYPPLPISWKPAHIYVPSAQGVFTKIVNSAESVFAELERIDFDGIARGVTNLIDAVNRKVAEVDVRRLNDGAGALLAEVRETNRKLQQIIARPEIDKLLADASSSAASLRRLAESPALTNSLSQLQSTLQRVDQLVAGKDSEIQTTLENLRALSENLRELSENAKRFPSQLLFGEPPKPTKP